MSVASSLDPLDEWTRATDPRASAANAPPSSTLPPLSLSSVSGDRAGATGWTHDLTHRLRVLLHAIPLGELRQTEALLADDRNHYDWVALALRLFDLIIDNMGLDREVDSRAARRALGPMLAAMDVARGITPDEQRHDAVVDRLLARLRNDPAGRQPFQLEYTDLDNNGVATRRTLHVRLLRDYHEPDGSIALRLTNEAINLFLNALELDLEDAQAAAEAVVQSQLARGKFDDAARSARNAKLASRRYADRITDILRETRRDIRRVDWTADVPRLLEESSRHLEHRIAVERNILQSAEQQHDLLAVGGEQARQVATVVGLIRDCMELHLELHGVVMRSYSVFLDEQARQAFAPRRALGMPELRTQVLEPMLTLPRSAADRLATRAMGLFMPPRPPALLWLNTLIGWQLRPRREFTPGIVLIEDRELETYGEDPLRYPAEVRAEADSYLATIECPTTLSAAVARAASNGASVQVLEALTFRVLQDFAPDEHDALPLHVMRTCDSLDLHGFYGDDMLIEPLRPQNGSAATKSAAPAPIVLRPGR